MIKVMIADLLYDSVNSNKSRTVPINIGYIVEYAKKIHGNKFDFTLYRKADDFINDFNSGAPSIVAFSQSCWNADLTRGILQWIKSRNPETLAVVGGPQVGTTEESVETFYTKNPVVDFCVPAYGEYGFSEILHRYLDVGGNIELMKRESIKGVSFTSKNRLVSSFAEQLIIKPDEIPSPYLSGLLDVYLQDGYSPVIQGMRGCPYLCTFCYASKLEIAKFSDKTVMDEIDYVYEKTKCSTLILTDDNFGLYKRDIEIAKKVKGLYEERGYPSTLNIYYSKKPTKIVVEISKILGALAPFFISYQSRNEKTLDAIKRYNLVDDNSRALIQMSRESGVFVTSEMIFGLPNETKESFMTGVEELYKLGVDSINLYQCKVLDGTDMATKKTKSDYSIITKHRFYEDNFQLIKTNTEYGDIMACETDEVPVSSTSYSLQDFLEIRMLGFWNELFFCQRIYFEVLKHFENYGFSPFQIIYKLTDQSSVPVKLRSFIDEVKGKFEEELHETHDDLKSACKKLIKSDPDFKSKKINYYFGYLLIHTDMRNELDSYIKTIIKEIASQYLLTDAYQSFVGLIDELFDYHSNRIINPDLFEKFLREPNRANRQTQPLAKDLNQGAGNDHACLSGGVGVAKMEAESVPSDNSFELLKDINMTRSNYSTVKRYNYDFVGWENDNYLNKINKYKISDGVCIGFAPKNPIQYEEFLRSASYDARPFVWHRYIYPNNVRSKVYKVA